MSGGIGGITQVSSTLLAISSPLLNKKNEYLPPRSGLFKPPPSPYYQVALPGKVLLRWISKQYPWYLTRTKGDI